MRRHFLTNAAFKDTKIEYEVRLLEEKHISDQIIHLYSTVLCALSDEDNERSRATIL